MAIAASAVLQTRYTGALALHFSIPGGLAQLGERLPYKQDVGGSIPSTSIAICILNLWSVGQAVKTPPFHGGNTGSIPVRIIILAVAALAAFQTGYEWMLVLSIQSQFNSFQTYGPLVKRLRHRPFTAVTRVRFPYGSLT